VGLAEIGRPQAGLAARRLGGLTHETIKIVNDEDGKEQEKRTTWPCWLACEPIPQLYQDETLPNVQVRPASSMNSTSSARDGVCNPVPNV